MEHGLARAGVLSAFALLVGFYLAVGAMVLMPPEDEDFRRTYLTREFGVYPPSAFFKGRNGLDYTPGETVDLTKAVPRQYLNRFDWLWRGPPGVWLDGYRGRIFLHVRDDLRRPEAAHRLSLTAACAYGDDVAGRFTVSVNGVPSVAFACPAGTEPFTVVADLPPGSIGRARYDEIRLERTPEGLSDRFWTALGQRLPGFALVSFKVEAQS